MPNFGKFSLVNPVIYSSLCAFLPPKVNCAIYSAWLVYVSACIWSRVKCPILVSFSRWILLFTTRCVHFCLPKWIAPSTVHSLCVCVRGYDLESIVIFPWVLPGELCYLQLAVCIYASQSELRHLQCTISVWVCLHMILGQMPNFGKFFPVESCYLQLAVCIDASQSELRHLQCMVSVCVCVHMI